MAHMTERSHFPDCRVLARRTTCGGGNLSFTGAQSVWEISRATISTQRCPAASKSGETLDSVKASLESARKQLEEERAAKAEQDRRMALVERLVNILEGGQTR